MTTVNFYQVTPNLSSGFITDIDIKEVFSKLNNSNCVIRYIESFNMNDNIPRIGEVILYNNIYFDVLHLIHDYDDSDKDITLYLVEHGDFPINDTVRDSLISLIIERKSYL